MPGRSGVFARVRRWQIAVSVLAVLSLAAGLLAAVQLLGGWGSPPAASGMEPVPVHQVRGQQVKIPPMPAAHRGTVRWPAAGAATAVFTARTAPHSHGTGTAAGATAGSARAGTLPVQVGPPAGSGPVVAQRAPGAGLLAPWQHRPAGHTAAGTVTTAASAPPVSRASVTVAPQSSAAALGVHGMVLTVTRADGSAGAGRVHVSVDYQGFADAYGGGYASRLHLVQYPACALSTPQVAACRKQTVLVSADDVKGTRVGADVIIPGTAAATTAAGHRATGTVLTAARASTTPAAGAAVLAVTATAQGSAGDYGAEPLSEENQWVSGGNSGAYTYSYPVPVPPVPGGLEPTVALQYDSQRTDGLNASTNNEASWVGDGWDYVPGFIQDTYQVVRRVSDSLCAGIFTIR